MFKTYPIPEDAKKCCHFTIKVDGDIVEAYSCMVSAIPFNTPWPGHQRSVDQAEEASFIYFDTDEIVDIEIDYSKFDETEIYKNKLYMPDATAAKKAGE